MRVACFQMPVVYGDPVANIDAAMAELESHPGLDLAVFPEAFLTGYAAANFEEAQHIAVTDPGILAPFAYFARETNTTIIIGALTRDGETVRNRAYIIGPNGISHYDKTHLPHLGADRFVTAGDTLDEFEIAGANVGVLICYDLRPPEATRSLALRGIDLLALPTNWPEGAETSANHVSIARAAENKIFVLTCNRVGTENGFRFIGKSRIIDPTGRVIAEAGDEATVIIAEIDPELARAKRTVNIPDEYELDIMGCRRPELYAAIGRPFLGSTDSEAKGQASVIG